MPEGATMTRADLQKPRRMLPAVLTALILAAMSAYTLASFRPGDGGEAYFGAVREAIDALPEQIGGYYSENRTPQQAAQQLLRPNRIVQRLYHNPAEQSSFSLLVVHCKDVRDMQGHYPPNCYPNAGWSIDAVTEEQIERESGGPIPITRYVVSRGEGAERMIRVIANTFIVPRADSPLGPDDRVLDEVTKTRWSSGLGAAQVQITTDANMDEATRAEIERGVAEMLGGVIETIANPQRAQRIEQDEQAEQAEQGEGS